MVLHHVAQLTHSVVISPPPFDPHLFRNGNLNMIDTTLIPLGIDKAIGKSQHQKVLDRLLAQVMINPVDILLIDKLSQCFIDLSRRIEAFTNRLFKDDTARTRQTFVCT